MNYSIDRFSEAIARPTGLVLRKAGLSLLSGLFISTLIYSAYYKIYGPFLDVMRRFVTEGEFLNFKLVIYVVVTGLLLLLLLKTPLKAINHPALNLICSALLLVFVFTLNKTVAIIISAVILILLLWKGYRGDELDYDYTFNPYGDARWASYRHLFNSKFVESAIAREKMDFSYVLGRTYEDAGKNEFIRFEGEGHILTVAKTGAGKGIGVVIPNLLSYKGPDRPVQRSFKADTPQDQQYRIGGW
jgi:type IV secretory pathway TraG/TraD family ATPase VirD4